VRSLPRSPAVREPAVPRADGCPPPSRPPPPRGGARRPRAAPGTVRARRAPPRVRGLRAAPRRRHRTGAWSVCATPGGTRDRGGASTDCARRAGAPAHYPQGAAAAAPGPQVGEGGRQTGRGSSGPGASPPSGRSPTSRRSASMASSIASRGGSSPRDRASRRAMSPAGSSMSSDVGMRSG